MKAILLKEFKIDATKIKKLDGLENSNYLVETETGKYSISAYSRNVNPNNEYAFVSEKFAWQMLYRWVAINPVAVETIFRQATGFPAKKTQHKINTV